MQHTSENQATLSDLNIQAHPVNIEDYSGILSAYNTSFTPADHYYLQVGEIGETQGWILHISVVISQLEAALKAIIPVLLKEAVPFKIAATRTIAKEMLRGNYGARQIGKLICIYPGTDEKANHLLNILLELTKPFKGPTILTDYHLGGVVYARYSRFINNTEGILTKDESSVFFIMPNGISWPFVSIPFLQKTVSKKRLKDIYQPIYIIKEDMRGHVIKGHYIKGFLRVGKCIIKQGNFNMSSDDTGRDICDRLLWQKEIHERLCKTILLPKILDYFEQGKSAYLVMEYIDGRALSDQIKKINYSNTSWFHLPVDTKLQLLSYLSKIIDIIEGFHKQGFIHRDITTVNFLIDKKDNVIPIDVELSYHEPSATPVPPFDLGTVGFMSPEQMNIQVPTTKEDIFSLGALMTEFFTGLYPSKFNIYFPENLYQCIYFFLHDKAIAEMIVGCMHPLPGYRPTLDMVKKTVDDYVSRLGSSKITSESQQLMLPHNDIKATIIKSLKSLAADPILVRDLWFSKLKTTERIASTNQREYKVYPGFYEGLGGALYLIGKAKNAGFNVEHCMQGYGKSWRYIQNKYYPTLSNLSPGLYHGTAAIALAYAMGVKSGLLRTDASELGWIKKCLDRRPVSVDIESGAAGQMIAILQCADTVGADFGKVIAEIFFSVLQKKQKPNGSWM
jgi:serine/threonine protein kinase